MTLEDHLRAVLDDADHPAFEHHVRAALQITAADNGSER